MARRVRNLQYVLVCAFICAVCGCAAPGRPPAGAARAGLPAVRPAVEGFYHTALRGQTLWRISRMYDVDMEELAAANRIQDAARIETGQRIFIPGRKKDSGVCLLPGEDEDFLRPLRGKIVSGGVPLHKGLNIAPAGKTPVLASKSGRVVFLSDDFLDLGRTMIIDHGGGFLTVYGRLAEVTVSNGDMLGRGAVIASAGSTARDGRTYLHFQIRKAGVAQNPNLYLTD